MERTVKFLADVPLYADWVYKCEQSEHLATTSENEFYYYITLNFPFPMMDRDLAVHSIHHIDSLGIYRSHSTASLEYTSRDEDYIHITHFESTWIVTPQPSGELLIDYQAFSDPEGDIPVWLINLAIDQGPFHTMQRFLEHLEREE